MIKAREPLSDLTDPMAVGLVNAAIAEFEEKLAKLIAGHAQTHRE